jgi:hypothetical protein
LCSADVDASSFDVLLALQTLRIAIHRRKGATLKFLFIVVLFFGGCFTLFKDTEVILPAIVTAGARALLAFATSAHAECFPVLAPLRHADGRRECPELGADRK